MRKQGRSRKIQKLDRDRGLKDMAERSPDAKAARRFVRKAYETYTVTDVLKKWGVDVKKGVEADGRI